MANERFMQGRSYTGVEIESSYATAPDPDVTFPGDEVYMEEFTPIFNITDLPNLGESPYRPGFKGSSGKEEYGFTGRVFFAGLDVDDTGSYPNIVDVLRTVGFGTDEGYDAGPPKQLYHELQSFGHASTSWAHRQEIQGGKAGELWLYRGCRGTGKIMLPRADRISVDVDVRAKSLTRSPYTVGSQPALLYADSLGEIRAPLVNKGVTADIVTLEGSPNTYAGKFIQGEIDLNMGFEIPTDSEDANGIDEVILVPKGPILGNLVIQAVPKADFDPWALKKASTPLHVKLSVPTPDGATQVVVFDFYCRFSGVPAVAWDEGRWVWTIPFEGLYPEAGRNDDTVLAGRTPANNLRIYYKGVTA